MHNLEVAFAVDRLLRGMKLSLKQRDRCNFLFFFPEKTMFRQHKQIIGSCDSPQPKATSEDANKINWDLCALCQTASPETLICPAKRDGAGYTYVAETLSEFRRLGHCPIPVDLSLLDEGDGYQATFQRQSAQWHKRCRTKVSSDKLKRRLKAAEEKSQSPASPVKTRRLLGDTSHVNKCILCDSDEGTLHEARTLGLDYKVRKCAEDLQDRNLLAKLASGDMVAIDAMYHRNCLTSLYRRAEKLSTAQRTEYEEDMVHALCFAETVSYIENFRDNTDTAAVFSMPHLCKLYRDRLAQSGVKDTEVHSTRLRKKLLAAVPDLTASLQGREYVLMFDRDLGDAIKKACSYDSEALHLAKTAQLIRRELFQSTSSFDGRFKNECQENSVPSTLKALISMIVNGPDSIQQTASPFESQAVLSISQIIAYNCKKSSKTTSRVQRHRTERETPLPIYISLKVHCETRKRGLVEMLHSLGLGISYSRVLSISTDIANSVCQKFEAEGLVFPPKMIPGLFTVGAVDNIDHNPSSTTARDSFHGTSISLMQDRQEDSEAEEHPTPLIQQPVLGKLGTISPLPASYTSVHPVALPHKEVSIPPCDVSVKPTVRPETRKYKSESEWLKHCKDVVEDGGVDNPGNLSWSAFHATREENVDRHTSNIGLLPLLMENAHSVAMVKHAMNVVQSAIEHLNPGQLPVLAMDQPLYALAKEIQWSFPGTHGEHRFLIMMGGLHIEMAAFKLLGDWLNGSGWTNAITEAGLASSGVADSFLRASHLTRTRHAHQVTAATLYILQHRAFSQYIVSNEEPPLSFEEWCQKIAKEQPQFAYWAQVLDLQKCILMLVHSIRSGDFLEYRESLSILAPWMFALDHINYARWLSVHIRDLCMLESQHPEVFSRFTEGGFVVCKTKRKFSAIALDHAHEQCNALVKGEGGAVGLTNNTNALKRWMIAGPEICKIVKDFEEQITRTAIPSLHHHEQLPSIQKTFMKEVRALTESFVALGNPFAEDSGYLIALDTKDIMPQEVVQTINSVLDIGQQQYDSFVEERFVTRSKPVSEPIRKNKLPCFSKPETKGKNVLKANMTALKNDCSLFSRLYIACQTRDGDIQKFFQHENQPYPPSLSKLGELRSGKKADLIACLFPKDDGKGMPLCPQETPAAAEDNIHDIIGSEDLEHILGGMMVDDDDEPFLFTDDCFDEMDHLTLEQMAETDVSISPDTWLQIETPTVDAKILDGAVVVQMLPPKLANTFQEYADNIFLPYIVHQLETVKRLDVVWDVYVTDSLKAATRQKRGSGIRRRVIPSARIPGNWKGFLRVSENKEELFHYLATKMTNIDVKGKVLFSTQSQSVLSSPPSTDTSSLAPCSHEEADTRLLLHASDCARHGFVRVMIRTTDTDVVILAVSNCHAMNVAELWIAFGTGKHFQYIPAHEIALQLGPRKAEALTLFHAFTGCDTVSFFAGKGKATAWEVWRAYPQATEAFLSLATGPDNLPDNCFEILERFVVLLYDRTSQNSKVNLARQSLFASRGRSIENIPPTQAALKQHVLRATYQGGHVWGNCLVPVPSLPNPANWGWQRGKNDPVQAKPDASADQQPWVPLWSTLEQAAQSCHELIRCSCKQSCRQGRCTCKKNNLSCTTLCHCAGDCSDIQ